jgi:hypothetical protein
MRQPRDPNDVTPPDATLYRAAISLDAQETQLIWTRYTGFVVMNGFFVQALTNDKVREHGVILTTLGVVILVLNCVWHALNYAGWLNQNLQYRLAGNLFNSDIGLLTDYFRTKHFTPVGWIYWLAQVIPTMFSLMAIPCLANGINVPLGIYIAWIISASLWLIAAFGVLYAEKAIAGQISHGVIEPA